MNLFLSWSGGYSKKIAISLKKELTDIFGNEDFHAFMSEKDIISGDYWFQTIKSELEKADVAILCITKENVNRPWINFEAGGMALNRNLAKVIPLVFDTTIDEKSPLSQYERVDFKKSSYEKLLKDLRSIGGFEGSTEKQFKKIIKDSFSGFSANIQKELEKLSKTYFDFEIAIYPENKKNLNKGVLFISSPMASLKINEYTNFRNSILRIKEAIKKHCSFSKILYPGDNIITPDNFEGEMKALKENFAYLKECECILVIYPKKVSSSTLVEMGYALALSKRMVICCRKRSNLPYIIRRADRMSNVTIYEYTKIQDICKEIEDNGMSFFCD